MAFREGFAPQKAGALVALMAAAILGNYFSLNLFFGVDFLFGSIAAKPRDKGTGLGLAQVYGIVKQHGGEIAVESEAGKGTAFCMYFPEVEASYEVPQRRHLPRGQGETVLVVEDDAGVLRVVQSVLKMLGYETLIAGNGREALKVYRARRDRIQVVLTDVVMPEMGGLAFLKGLRAEGADVPVVVMSGYPLGDEGVPEGVAGMLSKPLNSQDVAPGAGAGDSGMRHKTGRDYRMYRMRAIKG